MSLHGLALSQSKQPRTARVKVVQLEPGEGSQLDESTILKATLEYERPVEPGKYIIAAMFDTKTANVSIDGNFPNDRYPEAKAPSGKIVFAFPMKYVIKKKTLSEPIRVQFLLLVQKGQGMSAAIAKTQKYEFQKKK